MDGQELTEDKMPPKMRKKWIHREFESLKEANGHVRLSESMSIDSLKNPQGVGLGIHIDSGGTYIYTFHRCDIADNISRC